jgi:DNA replication protein DnaC
MDRSFLYRIHAGPLEKYKEKISSKFSIHHYDYFIRFLIANIPLHYIFSVYDAELFEKNVYMYDIATEKLKTKGSGPKVFSLYGSFLDKILKNPKEILDTSFVFFGFNESGKTHSAIHMLCYLIDEGQTGYYIQSKDLVSLTHSCAYNKDVSQDDKDLLKYIYECDFLVVDELGKEPLTEPSIVALEMVIKSRQASLVSTVFVSNHSYEDIKQNYKSSIWSALCKNYVMLWFDKNGLYRHKTRLQ